VAVAPAAVDASYGQLLSDLDLPTGWTWDAPSTVLTSGGTQSYNAKYLLKPGVYVPAAGVAVAVEVGLGVPVLDTPGTPPVVKYDSAVSTADIGAAGYAFKGAMGEPLTGTVAWKNGGTAVATGAVAADGSFAAVAVFTPTGASATNYGPAEFQVTLPVVASDAAEADLGSTLGYGGTVTAWLGAENDGLGIHTGLHADDYPTGVFTVFSTAYTDAQTVAGNAMATQNQVLAATATLKAALAALVPEHTRVVTQMNGMNASASPWLYSGMRITLTAEVSGHLAHVKQVVINGPYRNDLVLWAASGTLDDSDKPLVDTLISMSAGTLKSGSAVLELDPYYVGRLPVGVYTVRVYFEDPLVAAAAPDSAVAKASVHEFTFQVSKRPPDPVYDFGDGDGSGAGGGSGSGDSGLAVVPPVVGPSQVDSGSGAEGAGRSGASGKAGADVDSDGDGFTDSEEQAAGSDAHNAASTPLNVGQCWALLNLVLMVLTIAVGVMVLVVRRQGTGGGEAGEALEKSDRRRFGGRVLAVFMAVLALVLFVVTENLALPLGLVDGWTPVMGAIAAAQVVAAMVLARRGGQTPPLQEAPAM